MNLWNSLANHFRRPTEPAAEKALSPAEALQTLVAERGAQLREHITTLFPSQVGRSGPSPRREPTPAMPQRFEKESAPLPSPASNYLQYVDGNRLIAAAKKHDVVLHLTHRPGDFLLQDAPLAYVWPGHQLTHEVREELQSAFPLSSRRSHPQDIGFSIQQLSEIACRALSPAVNEPYTAIACINWLAAGLRALTGQPLPSPFRYDDDSQLRVIAPSISFGQLAEASFLEIRHAAIGRPAVTLRLIDIVRELASFARRAEDRRWLRAHLDAVKEDAERAPMSTLERRHITESHELAHKAILGEQSFPDQRQ